MNHRLHLWPGLLVAWALAIVIAPTALAEDLFGVQVHGFGGWYYGRSSDLQFLDANEDGNAQTAQFALNISAQPSDRVAIVAQVNLEQGLDGDDVELDYAFVNYDVTSRLQVRAGRAKHPWGIYGEIFDVGTLRPFQHLSQAVYGPVGFTAKAYNGVGLTGSTGSDSGWGLQYDVYGGEIEGDYEDSGLFTFEFEDVPQKVFFGFSNRDVLGTRLQLNTPVDGLWVGVSAYRGDEFVTGAPTIRKEAYLWSLEYRGDRLLVRAETGNFDAGTSYHGDATYLEVAYRITTHLQLAGRWDEFHLYLDAFNDALGPFGLPPLYTTHFNPTHSERIVGINYWVNPNFVVRASYSRVTGVRLLFPTAEELNTLIQTGQQQDDESDVLLLGAQFSF